MAFMPQHPVPAAGQGHTEVAVYSLKALTFLPRAGGCLDRWCEPEPSEEWGHSVLTGTHCPDSQGGRGGAWGGCALGVYPALPLLEAGAVLRLVPGRR